MTDVYRIFEKSTRAITSDKKCYGGQAFDANTTTIHFQILDKGSDWDFVADGYRPFIVFNVYDQYGCFWNPDKYDENRTQYPDPFAKFCEEWPSRARFSAKFSFDKNGHLRLEPVSEDSILGLSLIYHKNPGFKPVKPQILG